MRYFQIVTFSFVTSITACGGGVSATGDGTPGTKTDMQAATVEYVGTCTQEACADLPVPQVACASPQTTTSVCEPSGGGSCVIDIECGASVPPPMSPICDPATCGAAIPTLAPVCAPGGTIVNSCVQIGTTCEWRSQCIPPDGATCTAGSCGPQPTISPVCPDSDPGSLVCVSTASGGCGWVGHCSGTVGTSPAKAPDGGGSTSSSPVNDAGGDFDAAAWADAIGL